jgi:hypothetical protein
MLAIVVVVVGVLALVQQHSAFVPPGHGKCNPWVGVCTMVNPTIPHSRNLALRTSPPVHVATASVRFGESGNRGEKDMSSLKTGTKLHGTVVYSTPFAAFISAGTVCVGLKRRLRFT